ncbi:MAG: hypothetical protein ACLUFN_00800 [Eubacterium sp.]
MYFIIDKKKCSLELFNDYNENRIKINIKKFVDEILNLDCLNAFILYYKNKESNNYENYLNSELSNDTIKLIKQLELFPPTDFLIINNIILLLDKCDWIFNQDNKKTEYEINHIANRITIYASQLNSTKDILNSKFISTLDMLAHDVSLSIIRELNVEDANNFFAYYMGIGGSGDPEILRSYLSSKDFSEFLYNFNLSNEQYYSLSFQTQAHLKCLYTFINTATPIRQITEKEESESRENKTPTGHRFIEFKYLSPCLFSNLCLDNRIMLFDYINECKEKYRIKNSEIYFFNKKIDSLLYFCILYLIRQNIATFKHCKYCGRITMDTDSCAICKANAGEIKENREKFHGKVRTAKNRFKNTSKQDNDQLKRILDKYYTDLLDSIYLLYEETIMLMVKIKSHSYIYNQILAIKEYEYEWFFLSNNFKEFEDTFFEEDSIYPELNNNICEIEKLYITPDKFYQLATDNNKFYEIDELINRLKKINDAYYLKTKLNIEPFTKIMENYYSNLYKEFEKNELFFILKIR